MFKKILALGVLLVMAASAFLVYWTRDPLIAAGSTPVAGISSPRVATNSNASPAGYHSPARNSTTGSAGCLSVAGGAAAGVAAVWLSA